MKVFATVVLFNLVTVFTTIAQQRQMQDEQIERPRLVLQASPSVLGPSEDVNLRFTIVERDGSVIRLKGSVQIKAGALVLSADQAESERDGSVIQLKGSVHITTDAVDVSADEADYDGNTGEIRPRGNVQIRILTKPTKQ
jgi:lipopolysaccharide assembly outer membrane protein LptD (OstA)